jgi:predicted RNA-binding Zn-ribbon protein involved in translation (DUF1610 family)
MSNHINFLRRATGFSVYRIKNDIHKFVESLHNSESRGSRSGRFAEITGLRAETFHVHGADKLFRRIFVLCNDTGEYGDVGWVIISDAEHCMVCGTSFAHLSGGKHHCRACGNVICDKCSPGRELVHPIESVGEVRVCKQCYFDQSPVEAIPNIHSGRPVLGEFIEDENRDEHGQVNRKYFANNEKRRRNENG